MKAQSAIELMMIVGAVLAIIIPLSAYIWQQNEIATRTRQAEIAANIIAAEANSLYAQGPGARSTISVYFPAGYDSTKSSVSNRIVKISVFTPSGVSDFIAVSKANMTGTLPVNPGYRVLKLEMLSSNVNVTSVG